MNKGVVVKSTGSWYQVRLEDDKVWDSRIVGKFRLNGKKITNPVAVGDEVMVLLDEENQTALIKEILPRRNYVARQSLEKNTMYICSPAMWIKLLSLLLSLSLS